jgi:hypothetical protein
MGPYGPYWNRGPGTYICCRPAHVARGRVDHCWVQTPNMSIGLGGDPNIRPGEEYESMYVTDTIVQDHSRDMATTCTLMNNVDQPCVENKLSSMLGKSQGRFSPANNCQAFAYGVVNACRTGPQMAPSSR